MKKSINELKAMSDERRGVKAKTYKLSLETIQKIEDTGHKNNLPQNQIISRALNISESPHIDCRVIVEVENNDYISFIINKLSQVSSWKMDDPSQPSLMSKGENKIALGYYHEKLYNHYHFSLYAPEAILDEWKRDFHQTFNADLEKEQMFLFFFL